MMLSIKQKFWFQIPETFIIIIIIIVVVIIIIINFNPLFPVGLTAPGQLGQKSIATLSFRNISFVSFYRFTFP